MPAVLNSSSACTVCQKIDSSYKCPKCRSAYCSIQCNKEHKSVCPSQSQITQKEISLKNKRAIPNNTDLEVSAVEVKDSAVSSSSSRRINSNPNSNIHGETGTEQKSDSRHDTIPAAAATSSVPLLSDYIQSDIKCDIEDKKREKEIVSILTSRVTVTVPVTAPVQTNNNDRQLDDRKLHVSANTYHSSGLDLLGQYDSDEESSVKSEEHSKEHSSHPVSILSGQCNTDFIHQRQAAVEEEGDVEAVKNNEKINSEKLKVEKETEKYEEKNEEADQEENILENILRINCDDIVSKEESKECSEDHTNPEENIHKNVTENVLENVPIKIRENNHSRDSSELEILSNITINKLLQSDYLKDLLKSKRLRNDILTVDSSSNRQSALKKLRIQNPDFDQFLNTLMVKIILPSRK